MTEDEIPGKIQELWSSHFDKFRASAILQLTALEVQILDYSNAQIVTVETGVTKLDVERKLEILKDELTNLDYLMTWAKSGIINSFVLSEYELNVTKKHFDDHDMPYVNLVEALGVCKEITIMKPLPAVVNAPNTIANYEEMLSLKMLKDLHINNADEIKRLATGYKTTWER
ncbi:hypothetical protein EVAR_70365_1 [Eumeta japonica]|uniref:Uncharacterized protein n=1 Tax=Eumeta variegata TaxID=151549 RepID=A0A4C1TJM0_EUMVA|nr:hypothetical protein EVAR_70365_1 [Eumeta japonica]